MEVSKKPRIALIGLGGVTSYAHFPALKDLGYSVSACVDVDESRVKKFTEISGCSGYTNYKEMLSKESPDIVLVATPHKFHAQMAIDAINSGAHVYVEKPMAITFSEALSMVEASRKRERFVVVGHQGRFDYKISQAARIIHRGHLGRIYHARGFILRQRGIPAAPTFILKEFAVGGVVYDLASHVLDTLLFLTMFREPRRVKGYIYSAFADRLMEFGGSYPQPPRPGLRMEVEDFGSAMITFDDGLNIYVEVSWAGYFRESKTEYVVIGDRGGIHIDANLHYITSIEKDIFVSNPIYLPQVQPHKEAWRTFLRAIELNDRKELFPLTTVEQGAINVAILEKIYESAFMGSKEVDISIPRSLIDEALIPLQKFLKG